MISTADEQFPFRLGQAFILPQTSACRSYEAACFHRGIRILRTQIRLREIRYSMPQLQRTTMELEAVRFSVDLVSSPGFIVKTLEQRHSCTGMNRLTSRNMTFTLAARMIQPKVADYPKHKPREAAQDLLREHGITLSYPLAHWAKRQALESLYGDFSASFSAIH